MNKSNTPLVEIEQYCEFDSPMHGLNTRVLIDGKEAPFHIKSIHFDVSAGTYAVLNLGVLSRVKIKGNITLGEDDLGLEDE